MNILFLDDEQIRHDLADKYLANHTILHAFTAPAALDIVNANKIDLALLDRDLHHFVEEYGRKTERHGVWFVSCLLHDIKPELWFPRAIIHSYNADSARYMRDQLRNAGIS